MCTSRTSGAAEAAAQVAGRGHGLHVHHHIRRPELLADGILDGVCRGVRLGHARVRSDPDDEVDEMPFRRMPHAHATKLDVGSDARERCADPRLGVYGSAIHQDVD